MALTVRQDRGQFAFASRPPQCRPRHAIVPRWHYDMVLDAQRNEAYDTAIRCARCACCARFACCACYGGSHVHVSQPHPSQPSSPLARAAPARRRAVAQKRAAGCAAVSALDVGAGTGLLSMMAARAGAAAVHAVEVSGHMCDVAEEATLANGFLGKIAVLERDARRLDVVRKPDGTPPDMPTRADLLVYEVFDSGLIGEGVLHLLAAAKAKLLAPDAALVPLSATVYCQPIQVSVGGWGVGGRWGAVYALPRRAAAQMCLLRQPARAPQPGAGGCLPLIALRPLPRCPPLEQMRTGEVLGFDLSSTNQWRWRPDYEGIELGACPGEWAPLAPPLPVFDFDFAEAEANMRPGRMDLTLEFDRPGVFNAVAMWFELRLDEEGTVLSTDPHRPGKGPTWQQAVQWVPEARVAAGDRLGLTASHDTYGISFDLEGANAAAELARRSTGVPLKARRGRRGGGMDASWAWMHNCLSFGLCREENRLRPRPRPPCLPARRTRPGRRRTRGWRSSTRAWCGAWCRARWSTGPRRWRPLTLRRGRTTWGSTPSRPSTSACG